MLYLIGTGLDCNDLSLNALDAIKKCKKLYLENYTSIGCSKENIEKIINKKIILANRELIENKSNKLIEEAKKSDIGVLVYGDPLSATTHINYLIECKKLKIKFKVIHNISILTVIGETGLSLYNFGKTTSIPFNNKNILTPVNVIKDNLKMGLHTLILLDLDPENKKFLSIKEALEYLSNNNINSKIIICSALGTIKQDIKYNTIENLKKIKFSNYPQCFVIPGKLHFMEEETLSLL